MEAAHPGVLASQWIPLDPDLWQIDRYRDFLLARRELLAGAANDFFAALLGGTLEGGAPVTTTATSTGAAVVVISPTAPPVSEAERPLHDLKDWFSQHSLPTPELYYEITNDDGSEVLVEVDAAWPDGIQSGLGQPVAFLLEPDPTSEERLNTLNFRYFTSVEPLKAYALRLLGDGDEESTDANGGEIEALGHDVDDGDEVTDEVPAHVGGGGGIGGILALADSSGVRPALDMAIEVADRHGLGQRPFKKSLMLAPSANKTRVLVNIAIVGDNSTNIWISEDNWTDFYEVETAELVEVLSGVGRMHLNNDELVDLLAKVDDLLSSIDERADRVDGTSVSERVVTLLLAEPEMAFTADDVAERLEISRRVAGRRLSRLVSPRCAAKYTGAVNRLEDGRYQSSSAVSSAEVEEAEAPPDPADAKRLLHSALVDVAQRSKTEAGYNPTLFIQMLSDRGGLETAHALLSASGTSDGFASLWERGRLDLTMESVVLRPEFVGLFSPRELDVARRRLADHGLVRD